MTAAASSVTDGFELLRATRRQQPDVPVVVPEGITASALVDTIFQPVDYVVDQLVVPGVTILAGRPKVGKSWLTLHLAAAIGTGDPALGCYKVRRGRVLYLAQEDGRRRLQARRRKLAVPKHANIDFMPQTWPRAPEGVDALHRYLDDHPDTAAVVIDTWVRFRQPPTGRTDSYSEETQAAEGLHRLATDRGIAVLIVHHTRKGASEDYLDDVLGSTALPGVADTVLVLRKPRGEADGVLLGTGRDVEEVDLALAFDPDSCRWTTEGKSAAQAEQTRETAEVWALLKNYPEGLSLATIAQELGKKKPNISKMLKRMIETGFARQPSGKGGLYVASKPGDPD